VNVFLKLLGCRVNEAELEGWASAFLAAGYAVVDSAEHAGIVVINTCAVTREAGRKSRQAIYQARKAHADVKVVVTGCLAELGKAEDPGLSSADLVLGNEEKEQLVAKVQRAFGLAVSPPVVSAPLRKSRTRAFVKVQDGCRHRCTYCIVTVARGAERSRTIADVVGEVQARVAGGQREVVLTGIHLGGYGEDLGVDLAALVRAVLDSTDVERLRVSSLEPWNLPANFFELWEDPRLCPHLHLPLQSGSDTVLRRMARRCSTGEFAELVARARSTIPELTLTTDVIVGFPGETDAEWAETLAFVEQVAFGDLHVFSYSPREGTAAARMGGQLPKAVKRSRSQALRDLGAHMRREHLSRFASSRQQVLWEGLPEPGSTPELRRYSGYTRGYLRVEVEAPATLTLRNTISPVQCIGQTGDRLHARLLGLPAPAGSVPYRGLPDTKRPLPVVE
jgi:threonylcarbamoyladenosine tRNA methylthiotransferase MtaB